MVLLLFAVIYLLLPTNVQSNCCRLPFTNGLCRVNRHGPHRYQVMPDRKSGIVTESTECFVNDFDASYRTLAQDNDCNDCPGLLILHANSSEIFLFPEYLERILEGRPKIQRKNLVILTTSLVGAYDLDFTLFTQYYNSTPVDRVPSLYIDLELPPFDPRKEIQASLRLRLPIYSDANDGSFRVNREELINSFDSNAQSTTNEADLPFIYHFDIEKYRQSASECAIYEIRRTPSKLTWKRLDSEGAACFTFMPFFGRNPCFSTGFTRLFCPIVVSIEQDDGLVLSPYVPSNDRVEHLTLAVTGGPRVKMILTTDQFKPSQQVKILLLQGHLVVADINTDLLIVVEYGWDCRLFSLVVPVDNSATRYRRFDGEMFGVHEKNKVLDLPPCFRLIPNALQNTITQEELSALLDASNLNHSSQFNAIALHPSENANETDLQDYPSRIPIEDDNQTAADLWNLMFNKNNLIYTILGSFIVLAIIILCLGLFYYFCYNEKRRSAWTLKHESHVDEVLDGKKENPNDHIVPPSAETATQTRDQPIRI